MLKNKLPPTRKSRDVHTIERVVVWKKSERKPDDMEIEKSGNATVGFCAAPLLQIFSISVFESLQEYNLKCKTISYIWTQ